MKFETIVRFFKHIVEHEVSHGIENAFRFKNVLSSRRKGSLILARYKDLGNGILETVPEGTTMLNALVITLAGPTLALDNTIERPSAMNDFSSIAPEVSLTTPLPSQLNVPTSATRGGHTGLYTLDDTPELISPSSMECDKAMAMY